MRRIWRDLPCRMVILRRVPASGRPDHVYLGADPGPVVQHDAGFQLRKGLLWYGALYGHLVGSWDAVTGMGETIGQVPVVGKEEKPHGVEIQPPHGKDPLAQILQEIGHDGPALRILQGGDVTKGFVQDDIVPFRRGMDLPAVHLDSVFAPDGLGAGLKDRDPIDPNPSQANPFIGLSS